MVGGRGYWLKERWTSLGSLVVVLLITLVILAFRQRIAHFERYGYPGIFLISLFSNATLVLPVPGLAVTALGGVVFNPLWVGLVSGPGFALGELTGYLAGYSGRAALEKPERYGRIEGWMERWGAGVLFLLSAIPNPLFDLAGMAAGAMRFPLWRFLVICWLGKTVKALAVAYLGMGFSQLFGWLF